jgi:hypothetical protein
VSELILAAAADLEPELQPMNVHPWMDGVRAEKRAWLLVVGEYADEMVLGVVLGTKAEASLKAKRLTVDRVLAEEPVDMVVVRVEKTEVL